MTGVDGPAVDPEVFKIEGRCCAIRLPGMTTLSGEGSLYKLTPEARGQLVRDGVFPLDNTASVSSEMDEKSEEK